MEPFKAPLIPQQTCELSIGTIVEATEKRIVIQVNKVCHLLVNVEGYVHDHKAGEQVPICSILRIAKHGQIIKPSVQ